MTAAARELFRLAILRVLDANQTRFGLAPAAIAIHAHEFGFAPDAPAVQIELAYLEDKGFTTAAHKIISPENRAWRITANGRDELAIRG